MNVSSRTFWLQFVLGTVLVISACTGENMSGLAPTSSTANLAWDAVADASVSGYRVYFGTSSGKYLQPVGQGIDAGNVTTFTVSGLGRRTRYYFVVTAYNGTNVESDFSNEAFKDTE